MRCLFAFFLLCSCAAALASPPPPPSKSSTCSMPEGLMVNSVTTNTASFSWQGNAEHLSYTLYYRRAGLANWNGASPTTDTAQTIGGLEPGTVYEAYVMAQCSSGAAPSPAITFSTASFWNENDYGDFYSGSYTSRVGIGTAIPMTRLHLIGGFLAEGNGGGTPAQGPGTRLMWVPNRAALRAGSVSGPLWDADSIGVGSLALGTDAAATDSHSVAIGHNVRATAPNSMAFGFGGRDSLNQPVAGVNDVPNSLAFFAGSDQPVMYIAKKVGPTDPPVRIRPCTPNPLEAVHFLSDVNIYSDLFLRERDSESSFPCGGKICADNNIWSRTSVKARNTLGFSDACDPQNSFRFSLFRESSGNHEQMQALLPDRSGGESPQNGFILMRFHANVSSNPSRTNDLGVPEVSIGHTIPVNALPWRLRIGGAPGPEWSPGPRALLANGAIQIERPGAAWGHNYVMSLQGGDQYNRDNSKCFTVANGAAETFNVMGSGDVFSEGSLRVKKDVFCNRLKVTLDPMTATFPDYVFAPDYDLMPLARLRQFVADECHLPGVPSAAEVESEGSLDMGATQLQLLEKVEELTLYILQLDERMRQLETENAELRNAQR